MSQTSLQKHIEKPWKIKFLEKFRSFRKLFRYSKKEKALVELQAAKKCLRKGLDNNVEASEVFDLIEESERLFVEKRFDDSLEKASEAVRKIQVKRTCSVDTMYLGRKISRKYGSIPEEGVERKHVILKAASLVEDVDGLFTEKQVKRVLEQGFAGSPGLDGFLDSVPKVLENHDDVEEDQVFAGIPLYRLNSG
jgi:hypothetical protein